MRLWTKIDNLQFSSVTQLCTTFCDSMDCSKPGFRVHHQLLELPQTHVQKSMMPTNQLIFCHPLLLLPTIFPGIRVFSNESTLLMRWPKYRSFSYSIILSKEIPGLISFRMDWFSLKKESNLAICDNIDELQGYCANWNNSSRERKTLYNLTYMWTME